MATTQQLDEVVEAVHVLLASLASLARVFDRADEGTVYYANVMLFYKQSGLASISDIESKLRFFEKGMSLSSLAGGLELRPDLSIQVAANGMSAADGDIPAIVLPVPAEGLRESHRKTMYFQGLLRHFARP